MCGIIEYYFFCFVINKPKHPNSNNNPKSVLPPPLFPDDDLALERVDCAELDSGVDDLLVLDSELASMFSDD
jgi:hypothetical protein